jgi:hypothetical protein
MTAINFPDEPVDEEIFTSGTRVWRWSEASEVWEAVSIAEAGYTSTNAILAGQVFE